MAMPIEHWRHRVREQLDRVSEQSERTEGADSSDSESIRSAHFERRRRARARGEPVRHCVWASSTAQHHKEARLPSCSGSGGSDKGDKGQRAGAESKGQEKHSSRDYVIDLICSDLI